VVNFFKKVLALSQNISSQCLSSLDFKKPWSSHKYAQTLLACVSFFPHGHLSTLRSRLSLLSPTTTSGFPSAPPTVARPTSSRGAHQKWSTPRGVAHTHSRGALQKWSTPRGVVHPNVVYSVHCWKQGTVLLPLCGWQSRLAPYCAGVRVFSSFPPFVVPTS